MSEVQERAFVVFIHRRSPFRGVAGKHCVVELEAPDQVGALVYMETSHGQIIVGDYRGGNAEGWPIIRSLSDGLISEWNPAHISRLGGITWIGRTPPPPLMFGSLSNHPKALEMLSTIGDIEAALTTLREGFE